MDLLGGLVLAVPIIAVYFICKLIRKVLDKFLEALGKYKYKKTLNSYYKEKFEILDTYEIREFLKNMSDREFEYFCANLWSISKGYNATLTQKSRDGGKDVILRDSSSNIGYIECKHYAENNNVGIGIVQRLIGTIADDRVDFGILMTTGRVSNEAWKRSDKITIMDTDDIVKIVTNMNNKELSKLLYNTKNRIII